MIAFLLPDAVSGIISTISRAGYQAYIVGGCVRDAFLGVTPQDYDLTTDATPDTICRLFADCQLALTGLKHGTVTVIIDAIPYEITTFRTESGYADHRHPDSVAFSRSLTDDLSRRDFTVNAMAYSPRTGLVDPYDGQADLQARLIRCVGDPDKRFNEDALRIIRALRFAAVLDFTIDDATAAAIHRNRTLLTSIAAERISAETNKLLTGARPAALLDQFKDVLAVFIPEIEVMFDYDQHNIHHCYDLWHHTLAVVDNTEPDLALRWAGLLHDAGKPACQFTDAKGYSHFPGHPRISEHIARTVLTRLHNANWLISQVGMLIRYHDCLLKPLPQADLAAVLSGLGSRPMFEKLLQLAAADNLAQQPAFYHPAAYWEQLKQSADQLYSQNLPFTVNDLDIDGTQLQQLGYQGRQIGLKMKELLQAVLSGQTANENKALLSWLACHK